MRLRDLQGYAATILGAALVCAGAYGTAGGLGSASRETTLLAGASGPATLAAGSAFSVRGWQLLSGGRRA